VEKDMLDSRSEAKALVFGMFKKRWASKYQAVPVKWCEEICGID
jgi:hypothetical protein